MGRIKRRARGGAGRGTLLLASAVSIAILTSGVSAASAAPPSVSRVSVSEATTSSAKLEAQVNPNAKATRYLFEYGPEACPPLPNSRVLTPKEPIGNGSSPVSVSVTLKGLPPAALYHVRVVAENGDGETEGPDGIFATYSESLAGLPDSRAYEQSSPVDKNGGNAEGTTALTRASSDGDGITFFSTFGFPGALGAQNRAFYLASRESEAWSTKGLLPPATYGEGAQVLGWTPDFSVSYSSVTRLDEPRVEALVADPKDGEAVLMTAYVPGGAYHYVGATQGGAVVFFEARAKLPPEEGKAPITAAVEKAPNLYAWDRESGKVSLVSVPNEEGVPLPTGGFAGPYDWGAGTTPTTSARAAPSANTTCKTPTRSPPKGTSTSPKRAAVSSTCARTRPLPRAP